MPDLSSHGVEALNPAQRRVAAHTGGPLLVLGGPGTGKTRTLAERFGQLVAAGTPPERILALTASPAAAAALRADVEPHLPDAYEELPVMALSAFCGRLLHEHGLASGHDPFAVQVTPADRLAMLLDRVDELTLRHHDFAGDAAALLGTFVRRIDRLKEQGITAPEHEAWAAGLPVEDEADRTRALLAREFAGVYSFHEAMLAAAGALDAGDLVLRAARLLDENAHVRRGVTERFGHVLVDDLPDLTYAQFRLVRLVAEHGELVATGNDDAATDRIRGSAARNVEAFRAAFPQADEVVLTESFRCPERVLAAAAAVVEPAPGRLGLQTTGRAGGEVELWRCANERAQAQAVAADVDRLVSREGVEPERIAILVRSVKREGQAVAVALEERDVPHRLTGAGAFFQRAEIRDVLAWLRLLHNSGDAGAVVRALARPPIELRSVDLARCTQIARRRKLDMVAGLAAATESPQIPPEARERILGFLKMYRSLAAGLDTTRPDLYVHRLIERLGLRRQQLFAAHADVVERLLNLSRLGEMAAAHVRRDPQATARDFAHSIAAVAEAGLREDDAVAGLETAPPIGVSVLPMRASRGLEWDHVYVLGLHAARMPGARRPGDEPIADELLHEPLPPEEREAHVGAMRRMLALAMTRARTRVVLAHPAASERGAAQPPSPFCEEARAAVGGEWEDRAEELFGPTETLHATYRALRNELLETIARTASRLGELRFDTDLDVSHAVVRYLEVVKLAALIDRADVQGPAEALPEINLRLSGAMTSEQKEIFISSSLDELLLGAEVDAAKRAAAATARSEPSLEAFLPRRGEGLVLSAGDIDTYRACPLRYKFARVFRIPSEPTIHQRFGIAVHQVLERFHGEESSGTRAEMLGLLDAAWRRSGFGDTEESRQLRGKATNALLRYHERLIEEPAEPVWFERSFSFRLGPHVLRGRVDRVDRLPEGGYELIDYKTGRPRSVAQLREDVQLSLYALAAREAWELDAPEQSYYYVLDDEKVRVPRGAEDRERITDTVLEVADGIGSQGFEPTPSYSVCSMCDFRIACPAAER
jgi:DNA helicase-2/ATP-dependent DNA helicase PcrA